ncbi:DUF6688 domain-containing protein [Flavobacterium algicola]|uniref:DUF6688 domain-containing protein n=1 Tax=Flavobacterium algicola TaxID=556529 RepID=UPI001EFC98DA|nr:DUF6688 family protein [Flavobacterium algicola]MCG9791869.1 hypothetical protein [Flavobacterium algicola]
MTIILFFLIAISFFGYLIFKKSRQNITTTVKIYESVLVVCGILSLILFVFSWTYNSADYYTAIDIVDGGYTPFASAHILTLFVFFALSWWGVFALWLRGNSLPPLLFVLAIIFILIGSVISVTTILQLATNDESSDVGFVFCFLPIYHLIISISLLIKIVRTECKLASDKIYSNKYLNTLNLFMASSKEKPFLILILCFPVFIIVTAILMLLGQDYNSIAKVFTETTTWTFSQQSHPPFLDHRGHYLCTVAICGDAKVVKPLRFGKRHGHEIVVNRQLLIANAFEELIQESTPRLHKLIRNAYDTYGYPLSKKIKTADHSNLVYRLMKPLEYLFLTILYLCCSKPEEKINKQYAI